MLLNPTHKITFSGLPPDVLDAYVRYKKGTRALVAWFIQYSPSPNRRAKSLPIKELASLAQTVAETVKSLPDVIHFHFRETIAARKRLSKHFRGHIDDSVEDVDTINHEHFTTSLAQIYADLCTCCGQPGRSSKHGSVVRKSALLSNDLINHYNALPVEETEVNDSGGGHESLSDCPECIVVVPPSCESDGPELTFADDELSEALEVTAAIQRAQDIFSSIDQCWKLAAKGQISIATAAFLNNVAFALVRQVGVELLDYDEKLSVSGLHRLCCSFDRQNGQESSHSLLKQLQETEQSLCHYRDGHKLSTIHSCPACIQKPIEYIQSPVNELKSVREDFVAAIIDNIVHLITKKSPPTSIIRNSTPVYADIGYMITHPDEDVQSWSAIVGLQFLTQGYKNYLHSLTQPNQAALCRISALRLAQHALSQVSIILNDKTCFPCRCTQTLAYHLQNLEEELQTYAKYKCWDLYFQSPWVAGNHTLEVLDLCHYYGMRLFNYRHYVGAVIHSYNVLRQLAGLEVIPVLESLSDQFRDILFPGDNRPKSSFRSSWGRYVGARLKFKKGHKSRNSRESWCMAIPPHAARRAAGLGSKGEHHNRKIDCLLFRVKQQDYYLGDDEWADMSKSSKPPREEGTKRRSSALSKQNTGKPDTQDRLLDLAAIIEKSFTQSDTKLLPLTRLNLFAVFHDCVRVVSRLSDETHTNADEKGINCICFASAILTGADRIVDSRRLGKADAWKKDERECVSQASKAIKEVFANVNPKQWLWDI